jgi:hypothetical protein
MLRPTLPKSWSSQATKTNQGRSDNFLILTLRATQVDGAQTESERPTLVSV